MRTSTTHVPSLSPSPSTAAMLSAAMGFDKEALLQFYRNQVSNFELERREFVEAMDRVRAGVAETAELNRTVRLLHDRISELETEVSSLRIAHANEKELRILAEKERNDQLIHQRRVDDAVGTLLSQNRGSEASDITYFRNGAPFAVVTSQPLSQGGRHRPSSASPVAALSAPAAAAGSHGVRKEGGFIKEVHLSQRDVQRLELENLNLRGALEELQRAHAEELQTLVSDRGQRELDMADLRKRMFSEHERLSKENERLRDLLQTTTSEYLTYRHNMSVAYRNLVEKADSSRKELVDAVEELRTVRLAASEELDHVTRSTKEELGVMTRLLRSQLRTRGEETKRSLAVRDERLEKQRQHREKVDALVLNLRAKIDKVESRRRLDAQGYLNELALLRSDVEKLRLEVMRWRGVVGGHKEEVVLKYAHDVLASSLGEVLSRLEHLRHEQEARAATASSGS